VISRIPGASAQIVAYDIASRIAQAQATRRGDSNHRGRALESNGKARATTPVI
jgi:hypothetical protein